MKADDKLKWEDEEGNEKTSDITNFQFLKREVDQLKGLVNNMTHILRENKLSAKIHPEFFDSASLLEEIQSTEN